MNITDPLHTDNESDMAIVEYTGSFREYEMKITLEHSSKLAKDCEYSPDVTNTHISSPEQVFIKSEPDCDRYELETNNYDTSK